MTAKGGAMGEENGFVERPAAPRPTKGSYKPGSVMARLRETAENGKAIVVPGGHGSLDYTGMRRAGFKLHCIQQPDGTYLAWCERIEAQ